MEEENTSSVVQAKREATTYKIRLQLGVLDQAALKMTLWSHRESKFNDIHMYGKLRR
jgi:hypothetical protein